MIRMEIACFLVMGMVAFIYFSAERRNSGLHRTFSVLLIVVLVYLFFDGVTVYTVNHLDTIPLLLNDMVHRIFMGSMIFVVFLFYQYIAYLVEEETGKPRRMDKNDSTKEEGKMEITIRDDGSGFVEGKKAQIDDMLEHYARYETRLDGNSIGLLNAQKRIKLLCGREYGLYYTENEDEGVTAHYLAFEGGGKMKKLRVVLVDDEIIIPEGFKKMEGSTPSQYRRDFYEE